jgi:hypothetical protein
MDKDLNALYTYLLTTNKYNKFYVETMWEMGEVLMIMLRSNIMDNTDVELTRSVHLYPNYFEE